MELHDHEYHSLAVADVVEETTDTRSFVLDIPAGLEDTFAYTAGQFCTFRAVLDGEPVVRCYSMSSAPETGEPFTTTVKRVPGGRMSNWMNDALRAGDTIEVLRPTGLFVLHEREEPLVAFAGGSGITPVISIIKTALATTGRQILLVYANRSDDQVIFADELERLRSSAAGRLLDPPSPRFRSAGSSTPTCARRWSVTPPRRTSTSAARARTWTPSRRGSRASASGTASGSSALRAR